MNKTNLTDEPYHFLNESISEIDILKRKNAFLEQILNELPIAVYVHDSKNMQQVWGNTQAETRMGISTKEMNDRGIDWFLNQFHPDDIGVINENIKAFSDNKSNEFSGVYRKINTITQKWHWNYSKSIRLSENEMKVNPLILGIAVDLSLPMDTQNQMETIMKENIRLRNILVFKTLTEREKQILHFISKGVSTREIAEELKISYHTVSTHRKKIAKKLNLHCLASLSAFAIENGI